MKWSRLCHQEGGDGCPTKHGFSPVHLATHTNTHTQPTILRTKEKPAQSGIYRQPSGLSLRAKMRWP